MRQGGREGKKKLNDWRKPSFFLFSRVMIFTFLFSPPLIIIFFPFSHTYTHSHGMRQNQNFFLPDSRKGGEFIVREGIVQYSPS